MDLTALLLLVAFRHRIKEVDIGAGIAVFETIIGRKIDEGEFPDALARAVARGELYDPVRLLPGSLQCHWHVKLTHKASTPSAPCFVTLIWQQCHK